VGDIAKFQDTLAKYAAAFKQDKIYTLILRYNFLKDKYSKYCLITMNGGQRHHSLRHNVIKTGIRMMSLSYSRISLKDICLKLLLDSEEDAEYIVAKAIRDGVIDATIDHENGHMRSKENPDLYSTSEPQQAFHQRISFCLDLHNDSVKAMRFPGDAHRKELDSMTLAYEEERKLAKEIVEGELDDDEDMEDF
jgi:26S proteasome regulatory subunit N3